jgi:hypothetical protein
MGHRLVSVAGVVVGGVLLSGCTPAVLPLAAAWPGADGEPVVMLRPCEGDHATHLWLLSWPEDAYVDDGHGGITDNPTSTASPGSDTGWRAAPDIASGATTFPLFLPPSAWHVESAGPQELRPGRTYSLSFQGARKGWRPYDGSLFFTADDLASLRPGQVWADGRAMSRGEFGALVADKC